MNDETQLQTAACAPLISATRWSMRCFVVSIALLALTACSHLTPLHQVIRAEEQWQASGIQNYDFTLDIYSLMGGMPCAPGRGPIDVQVRDGQTVKFGACSPDDDLAQEFGTVPRMFQTIRSNLSEHLPKYRVKFHRSLGYPEFVDADYFRFATDSTAQYTIRDFREVR